MGWGHRAHAGEPTAAEIATARELFAQAEKDEDAGQWAAALEKLRRAGSVKVTPGIRFHVALCEEQLGQLVAALGDYAAAEAQARDERSKDVLDALSEPMAALRARVPTLTVNVPADARDATVTLDGAPLASATWATAMPVEIGTHTIVAKARARATFWASVTTAEHEAKVVNVVLAAAEVSAPPLPAPAPAPAPEPSPPRTAAVLASLGGVVLVGAGVASFLVAGNKQSNAETQCKLVVSCDDLKGPIRTFDWLALGAWIGGAAAGAVAIVLWASPAPVPPGSAPGEHPGSQPGAALLVGPGSLAVRASF